MTKSSTVATGVAVVLAVLILFLLLLPGFMNFEPVKSRLLSAISQNTGATVKAAKIKVSFLPRPSITLARGTVAGKVSGVFDALSMYPQVRQLFLGKLRLARIDINGPDFRVDMSLLTAAPSLPKLSLKAIEDKVAPAVRLLTSNMPGLSVSVAKGRVTLTDGSRPDFRLDSIEGRMRVETHSVETALACSSDVWQHVSVEMWIKPEGFKGEASLDMKGFTAGPAARRFFPAARPQVEDAFGDIALRLRVDGSRSLYAGLDGNIDRVSLRKGSTSLSLQKVRLKGALRLEGEKTIVSVERLESAYPSCRLSGEATIDPASRAAGARIDGAQADAAGARSAFLFFAGDDRDVRNVFDVVRAGSVSGAALSARGASLRDMVKAEHISAAGSVTGGSIVLPDSLLPVDQITGEMRITGGFLEGTGLSGRMGGNTATKSKIRLDLRESTPGTPFRLDLNVRADVAQIPFYLGRLVPDADFVHEIAMVRKPSGKAEGRVVYDSLQQPLQVAVDVESFALHAVYSRFPYPLDFDAGSFHYDKNGEQIKVQGLSGKAGKSSFSALSAELATGAEPYLTIDSGAAVASLQEIDPWLRSLEPLKGPLGKIGPVNGTVTIDGISMKGPISQPRRWQFHATGKVENVAAEAAWLPGRGVAKTGAFDVSQDRLSFSGLHAACLDASIAGSGKLAYTLDAVQQVEVELVAEMGDRSAEWVSQFVNLPARLRLRTPLSISKAHIAWKKDETSFSGDFAVHDGPRVALGLVHRPGEFTIRPLVITDAHSNASVSLYAKEKAFDCAFSGNLAERTIDDLFAEKGLVTGRINGNIEAHIIPGKPSASTARGKIEGTGISFPGFSKRPFKVAALEISAQGDSATLKMDFTAFDQAMSASGRVAAAKDAFTLDIDLSTGGLDLERIAEQANGRDTGDILRDLPIEGTVRLRPEYVSYGTYLWKPVEADVTFMRGPMRVIVNQAEICGISTPGRIDYDGGQWTLDFLLASQVQPVQSAFACLIDVKELTGVFAVNGEVTAKGKSSAELMQSLRGTANFVAKDGRIYRFGTLAKVLEIAGLSAIYAIPELTKNGFAYSSVKATLELDKDKIRIKECELDAASVDLLLEGEIDPAEKKTNLMVLVVPFTTASRIIQAIPGVRYVLAGRVLAIPVRVSGEIGRPSVTPLPPSAVGSELLGMGERFLKLPLKIIEKVLPRGRGSSSPAEPSTAPP